MASCGQASDRFPKNHQVPSSNAPAKTTPERLACMQGQRSVVERTFQDARTAAGMDHYQVRGWLAWHHVAMVMLSMLFLLETRHEQKASHPLLGCPDLGGLLAHFLPRRDITLKKSSGRWK